MRKALCVEAKQFSANLEISGRRCRANFTDIHLCDAHAEMANFGEAVFLRATLDRARLRGAHLVQAQLQHASVRVRRIYRSGQSDGL